MSAAKKPAVARVCGNVGAEILSAMPQDFVAVAVSPQGV
jgi:hypothetical protein